MAIYFWKLANKLLFSKEDVYTSEEWAHPTKHLGVFLGKTLADVGEEMKTLQKVGTCHWLLQPAEQFFWQIHPSAYLCMFVWKLGTLSKPTVRKIQLDPVHSVSILRILYRLQKKQSISKVLPSAHLRLLETWEGRKLREAADMD